MQRDVANEKERRKKREKDHANKKKKERKNWNEKRNKIREIEKKWRVTIRKRDMRGHWKERRRE